MTILGMIFLVIFALVLGGSYIVVRRNLLKFRTAAVLCATGSITALIAFGIAENLVLLHTLVLGVAVGGIFTAAMMLMAAFFQANQPDAAEIAVLKKEQPPTQR